MRICILSYIGTEDDIVETFVRHALGYADKMIIVSTAEGKTREILLQLSEEGLPIDIICHTPVFHDQHEVLTQKLHLHRRDADWFLLLDADEFVIGDIRSALEQSQPILRALKWKTYVPVEGDDISEPDILKRIRHRRSFEAPVFTKAVIPAAMIRWHTYIGRGNHSVSNFSFPYSWNWNWGMHVDNVSIAHFPVRDAAQMAHKIERSWPAVERNPRRRPEEAFHWARMHQQYAGKVLDPQTLTDIALRYSSLPGTLLPSIVEDPAA